MAERPLRKLSKCIIFFPFTGGDGELGAEAHKDLSSAGQGLVKDMGMGLVSEGGGGETKDTG